MKVYDCVVVGQDLYALTVALFLSRKMRKVLVIQDSAKCEKDFEKIRIKSEDKNFNFSYNRNNLVSGLDKSGLLYAYLDNLGLEKEIDYEKNSVEVIANYYGNYKKRSNTLDDFRIYLTRNYPKSQKEIQKFFEILHRLYLNYVEQYSNMLKNTDYTLTSLMIEWGDYSLFDLLNKYFSDPELISEFSVNNSINGLPMQEVSAYSFFSNYFVGLESGFYFLNNSYKELCDKCIEKIKLVNPDAFLSTAVKEFVLNKKKEVECIVDENNNLIYSKYFFVSEDPIKFYRNYFIDIDEDLKTLRQYYPNLDSRYQINTLYLALNIKLSDIEINDIVYYFKNNNESLKLVRMFNYTLATKQDLRRKEGLLCVDFAYEDSESVSKEEVIEKLHRYFPKIKKYIVGSKLGEPEQYLSMLRDEKIRRIQSINEMIDLETLEHIQLFSNLFVGGKFIRPEAQFFGIINQGFIYADKIEDKLYYGDNEEDFEYFSNDELMMMIRHNFQPQFLGNKEVHVNFHIGKSDYFVRTKGKNIVIHRGRHNNADLSVYTTNDKLADLLLKKKTFKQVLDAGSLKYRGNIETLFQAVNAFQLDDYHEYEKEEYYFSDLKFLGVKMLFAHLFIYALAAFLSNYIGNIYIFPAAFVLSVIISVVKYRLYYNINWFEIVMNVSLLTYAILSIFVKKFNVMTNDDIFLGFMVLVLFTSVFVNNPVVYLYHQFDMNIDYRNTKLFKIITNGLTFIWGFLFLLIIGGTYIAGERYVSVFYSFLFLGIFLTYYYPAIYVRTSIKK